MRAPKIAGGLLLLLTFPIGLTADEVDVQYLGVLPPPTIVGRVYINPYSAIVDGRLLTVLCDDFDTTIRAGQKWRAFDLSASAPAGAKFYDPTQPVYKWLTYLATQLLAAYSVGDSARQGVLSYAIWQITDHPFSPTPWYHYYDAPASFVNSVNAAVLEAKTSPADYTAGWRILTPTYRCAGQEFMYHVPEPSGLLLLSFGLVTIGCFLRRQRRGVRRR